MRYPSKHITIDTLHLYPGETITIFLRNPDKDGSTVQVECRIFKNGIMEIFCDKPTIVKSFSEWCPLSKIKEQ